MKNSPPNKQISLSFELLLQAALLSGEAAQKAYHNWKNAVDLEFLKDEFSYYLLPKLYLNQRNNSDSDKTLKKLKGIYRRTWLENQLRIPQLLAVLKQFEENRIGFIVLSQTPFVLNLLKDKGVFSLDNFDLLIDGKQILGADKILQKNGWQTKQDLTVDTNIFYRNENSVQLILRQSRQFESLRKNTVEIDFDGTKAKSLSLNQRIISLCENDENELWVFYFYLILTETAIAWKSLIAEASRSQVCTELFAKLKYLNEFFAINIPAEKLKDLQKKAEKEQSPPGKWKTAVAAYHSLQKSYRRELSDGFSAPSFWGFLKFLSRHWQTNSIAAIPWQIGKRFLRSKSSFK